MSLSIAILITIIILLSILSMLLLWREWARKEKRIENLEKQVADLQKANCQRLPYKSFQELLDAMVAIDKELEERNFYNSLLENAKGHIANAMAVGTKRQKDK